MSHIWDGSRLRSWMHDGFEDEHMVTERGSCCDHVAQMKNAYILVRHSMK